MAAALRGAVLCVLFASARGDDGLVDVDVGEYNMQIKTSWDCRAKYEHALDHVRSAPDGAPIVNPACLTRECEALTVMYEAFGDECAAFCTAAAAAGDEGVYTFHADGERRLHYRKSWDCYRIYEHALAFFESSVTSNANFFGQGCLTVECTALVLVHSAFEPCEGFSRAALADVQMVRAVQTDVVDGRGGYMRFPKGGDAEAAVAAFLAARGEAAPAERLQALARQLVDAAKFHYLNADLGSMVHFEVAHAEARRPVPVQYLADLAQFEWLAMPGAPWPTTYPAAWVRAALARVPARKTRSANFVGGLHTDLSTSLMRNWVVDFARRLCDDRCFVAFTDAYSRKHQAPLGAFDHSADVGTWRNPKQSYTPTQLPKLFDSPERADWVAWLAAPAGAEPPFGAMIRESLGLVEPHAEYYDVVASSEFTLAPAGDSPWSNRFYEAILCCSLPILQRPEHAGRTDDELRHPFFYYIYDAAQSSEHYVYRRDWATANLHTFLRLHTLVDLEEFRHFECPP